MKSYFLCGGKEYFFDRSLYYEIFSLIGEKKSPISKLQTKNGKNIIKENHPASK